MRTVLSAIAIAIATPGCVNDYLVGGSSGSSSTAAAASESSSSGTEASTSSCGGELCGDSTKASGDGTGHGDTVADTDVDFVCMACASDAECGDDFDNCATFDMLGALCLFACPEAGCPAGSTCRNVLSVDGVEAMQCAPIAGTCDPIGTDDGGDATTAGDPTTTGTMTGESASAGDGS